MKSKALSMKKLYYLAGRYVTQKYLSQVGTNLETSIIQKVNEEVAELNRFLRFVWEERNK